MTEINRVFSPGDLAVAAAGTAVRRSVLVQVLNDLAETRDFLALAAATAGAPVEIAAVVGWVDLAAPDVADQLAALRTGPGGDRLRGIRHLVQAEPDPGWLVRPDVLRGLEAVAAAGLTYDLLVTPRELPAAVAAVAAVPGASWVLDHIGKPPIESGWSQEAAAPWLTGITALAAHDNVAVKLSGMVTEANHDRWRIDDLRPWSAAVLDAFGPERVMFGSDWPVCLLAASYDSVVTAWAALTSDVDGADLANIGGGTATRCYRLG